MKFEAFLYGQSAPEMVRGWGTVGVLTMLVSPGGFERYVADLRMLVSYSDFLFGFVSPDI